MKWELIICPMCGMLYIDESTTTIKRQYCCIAAAIAEMNASIHPLKDITPIISLAQSQTTGIKKAKKKKKETRKTVPETGKSRPKSFFPLTMVGGRTTLT